MSPASSSFADPPASASAFARVGLLLYAALIVYASLYPFAGWRDLGVAPLAWVDQPLPRYWTAFDFNANILGYAPFGLLAVFALYPRIRGLAAFVLACLAGVLLSAVLESIQTYLPSRVSSNLDLLANSVGAVLGALAGLPLARAYLVEGRLLLARRLWFAPAAGRGLIVLALWPLAQIYPLPYLFGHGQVMPVFSAWTSQLLERPVDLSALLRHSRELTVEQYWLSETIITACGFAGGLLMLLCLLRERAPKWVLLPLLALAILATKALGTALQFGPDNAFAWLTPGAQGGILLALVMLSGLAYAPPVGQRRVAAVALLVALAAVNAVPANPYFLATQSTWAQGKFLNFYGAAQFLALLWPFLALWFLYHPSHRQKAD